MRNKYMRVKLGFFSYNPEQEERRVKLAEARSFEAEIIFNKNKDISK